MKVVLRSDVAGVGKRGDIVDIADGYGRNFLIPSGHAFMASEGVATQASAMRRARDLRDVQDREGAEAVAQRLVPTTIAIAARAGAEGRLFGSVTATDIVDAVQAQTGIAIDRHKLVHFEAIKSLGNHQATVRLHPEVEFQLTLDVTAN